MGRLLDHHLQDTFHNMLLDITLLLIYRGFQSFKALVQIGLV